MTKTRKEVESRQLLNNKKVQFFGTPCTDRTHALFITDIKIQSLYQMVFFTIYIFFGKNNIVQPMPTHIMPIMYVKAAKGVVSKSCLQN